MTHAEQLRQHAAELLRLADELDRASAFPRLLSKASRQLSVKEAAHIAGLSPRQCYRLAPMLGERVGNSWMIDEVKLRATVAKLRHPMANDGEQDRCFATSDDSRSHRKDRP